MGFKVDLTFTFSGNHMFHRVQQLPTSFATEIPLSQSLLLFSSRLGCGRSLSVLGSGPQLQFVLIWRAKVIVGFHTWRASFSESKWAEGLTWSVATVKCLRTGNNGKNLSFLFFLDLPVFSAEFCFTWFLLVWYCCKWFTNAKGRSSFEHLLHFNKTRASFLGYIPKMDKSFLGRGLTFTGHSAFKFPETESSYILGFLQMEALLDVIFSSFLIHSAPVVEL